MRASEPKLFELDPNSVLKLFEIIKEFVEFDLKDLKTSKHLSLIFSNHEYTIEEKFYIAHYLPHYLKIENEKTYISKRIKEIEELEDIDILESLKKNAKELIKLCNTKQKSLKRIYNYSLKSNILINDFEESVFAEALLWKKLPLNKEKKQEFLRFVYDQLGEFYKKDEIQIIIGNSFDILPFSHHKVSLLNLEMENIGGIRKAFYHIYKEYQKRKEEFKDMADNNKVIRLKPKNQKLIDGHKRADFITQLDNDEYGKATSKINIARIMFLTFSKVRENYLIDAKAKNKEDLNSYLLTYCRNIKQ